MSRIKRFFRTYRPFTRAGMQEMIAYRANFICFLIGAQLAADELNSGNQFTGFHFPTSCTPTGA